MLWELTACSRVLLQKLMVLSADQQIPCFLWNLKVLYHVQKNLSLDPALLYESTLFLYNPL